MTEPVSRASERTLPELVGWVKQEGLALNLANDRLAFLIAIAALSRDDSSHELTEAALPADDSATTMTDEYPVEPQGSLEIAEEHLPDNIGVEWSGMSYQEKKESGQTGLVLALALLFVFLFLAAQYESWSIPVAVMLVVPLGFLGVVLGTWGRGMANDVYFQVGLITIIGLSAKNAILIIEFARELEMQGKDILEAALEACRLRLR